MTLTPKTRVRVKAPKPLPSGNTVQLIGSVWYVDGDVYVVRIHTPGMYDGGVMRFTADEIEAI